MRSLPIVALLAIAMPASAADPPSASAMSLPGAIDLAVRFNPTLGGAVADVAVAAGQVTAAKGLDDFVLDARTDWIQNRQQLVGGSPVQQPSFDSVLGALSLTKPIPTGGRVGLRMATEYSRTDFATESSTSPGQFDRRTSEAYSPSLQLVFQHNLLRGAGVGVARADRRRSAVRREFADLTREATVAVVLRDVVSAYGDLAYATGDLEIRRSSVAAARDQLERVRADVGVGKQPPSGSAEVEVVIARREEEVLLAEQGVVDRSLELERLIGRPIESSTRLVASDALAPPSAAPSLEEALAAAMDHNPQLRATETQGRAATIEVEVTENGLLPQLDVYLSGGPAGRASDPRTAYSAVAGFQGYAVSAGLVFQEPIGRHAAHGANDAARATLRKAVLRQDEIRQQIAAAVVRGVAAVEISARRAEVLARSTESAALDLAAERARFESGRSTNFDVLRRQDELARVRLGALRARLDYMKSVAAVESLTGAILNHHGVTLR